jgi:hypothetical protein
MRMFVGLLVTLLASVGTVGDVQPRNANPEAAASQAAPSTTPKCEVHDAKDCTISISKQEFIRWTAPSNEGRNVCFDSPYPFSQQEYKNIAPGTSVDSSPIVLQPPPAKGTVFWYRTGKNPCPNPSPDRKRNTARVIVDN